MYQRANEKRTRTALQTLVLVMPLLAGINAKADIQPAAFLQPDPVTKRIPFQALKVIRGKEVVSAETPIQPCDRLEFVSTQSEFKQVRVTTYRSGKNIVLDSSNPSAEITCEKSSLSGAMAGIWMAISGGERVSYSTPATTKGSTAATTRGEAFALPIFSADRSQIVSGKRALVIPWVGGVKPYKVVLKRAATGDILADVKVESGHSVRLPEVDLQPGQYSVTVFNTPIDGSQPGLEEQNLHAVTASELPAMPPPLKNAKLDPLEAKLLYAFYLEGYGDGRWAFEAFQLAVGIQKPTSAVKDWLMTYTSSK
jgi:hypothetical protein